MPLSARKHSAREQAIGPGYEPIAEDDDLGVEMRPLEFEDLKGLLGPAKLIGLMQHRLAGELEVEKDSVYGAALAVPQIARSCQWHGLLLGCTVRIYVCLFLNIFLQGFLLYSINKEFLVWFKYAGQMHACDFSANLDNCPDGDGCVGPGGTQYTPDRIYDYNTWNTRRFVRDGMRALFPNRTREIEESLDPGEFGIESTAIRDAALFLFVVCLLSEAEGIYTFMQILWTAPSSSDSWVTFEVPGWANKEYAKSVHALGEFDLVKIGIGGIPLHWKIINLLFVVGPQMVLFIFTLRAGRDFLMESSGILDTIINATALGFILNIDELLLTALSGYVARTLLAKLESLELYSSDEDWLDDETTVRRYQQTVTSAARILWFCCPGKLIMSIIVWYLLRADYYMVKCQSLSGLGWVSLSMYLPENGVDISLIQAFFSILCHGNMERLIG